MKKKIIVSACILGEKCRYDGKSVRCPDAELLEKYFDIIPVCPEAMGGLPTPRVPSEIRGDRVINKEGKDVTAEYRLGAEKALKIAKEKGCEICCIKERSPSCGGKFVHDGTFSGKIINGEGVTAKLFRENGIKIYSEENIDELIKGEIK